MSFSVEDFRLLPPEPRPFIYTASRAEVVMLLAVAEARQRTARRRGCVNRAGSSDADLNQDRIGVLAEWSQRKFTSLPCGFDDFETQKPDDGVDITFPCHDGSLCRIASKGTDYPNGKLLFNREKLPSIEVVDVVMLSIVQRWSIARVAGWLMTERFLKKFREEIMRTPVATVAQRELLPPEEFLKVFGKPITADL